ncbi:MAG: NAC domain-containing protein [Candidatus Helarchaeota archaeon]
MAKWHKIKKQQSRRASSRSVKRAMRKFQQDPSMNLEEISDVIEVIIRTNNDEIRIERPESVTTMELPQQGKIYQIFTGMTGNIETKKVEDQPIEKTEESEEISPMEIPLDDVQLVAQQTGVSEEMARDALIKNKGDLAKAIIYLKK